VLVPPPLGTCIHHTIIIRDRLISHTETATTAINGKVLILVLTCKQAAMVDAAPAPRPAAIVDAEPRPVRQRTPSKLLASAATEEELRVHMDGRCQSRNRYRARIRAQQQRATLGKATLREALDAAAGPLPPSKQKADDPPPRRTQANIKKAKERQKLRILYQRVLRHAKAVEVMRDWDRKSPLTKEQRAAINDLYTTSAYFAQLKFAMDSGWDMIGPLIAALPPSDDEEALESEKGRAAIKALADKIKSLKPSDEQIKRAVEAYKLLMDTKHLALPGCAACGERDFVTEGKLDKDYPYIDVKAEADILKLTPQQLDEYARVPDEYKPCISVHRSDDGTLYHLHTELVERSDGTQRARLCLPCHAHVRAGKIPTLSLAEGFDYGRPDRIGLPELNTVEQIVIALYSVDMTVYKLPVTVDGAEPQLGIKGNAISFAHDAPRVAAGSFPNLSQAADTVRIVFVGPDDKIDNLKWRIRQCGDLMVRPSVVLAWLKALKALHPM
jgi:hypothetical protein